MSPLKAHMKLLPAHSCLSAAATAWRRSQQRLRVGVQFASGEDPYAFPMRLDTDGDVLSQLKATAYSQPAHLTRNPSPLDEQCHDERVAEAAARAQRRFRLRIGPRNPAVPCPTPLSLLRLALALPPVVRFARLWLRAKWPFRAPQASVLVCAATPRWHATNAKPCAL